MAGNNAEKWTMDFKINGQPASITRFKVFDSAGKGYLALFYDPATVKDTNIKHPEFFPTYEDAEGFLTGLKDKEDELVGSMWYNK